MMSDLFWDDKALLEINKVGFLSRLLAGGEKRMIEVDLMHAQENAFSYCFKKSVS